MHRRAPLAFLPRPGEGVNGLVSDDILQLSLVILVWIGACSGREFSLLKKTTGFCTFSGRHCVPAVSLGEGGTQAINNY